MSQKAPMIEAVAPTEDIRRAYNLYSHFYRKLAAPLERKARLLGLERAHIHPLEKILEVAVGPGATFLEILKKVDKANVVYGVDLSPNMLATTSRLLSDEGYANIDLREADARALPFPDNVFDVLYNSYMLDLLPLTDMHAVLEEFRRVLKPEGRLILVNFSKHDRSTRTSYERLYEWLPRRLVPYLLGGCRPVLMEEFVRQAGFCEVKREFIAGAILSEIVTARKPAATPPEVNGDAVDTLRIVQR